MLYPPVLLDGVLKHLFIYFQDQVIPYSVFRTANRHNIIYTNKGIQKKKSVHTVFMARSLSLFETKTKTTPIKMYTYFFVSLSQSIVILFYSRGNVWTFSFQLFLNMYAIKGIRKKLSVNEIRKNRRRTLLLTYFYVLQYTAHTDRIAFSIMY